MITSSLMTGRDAEAEVLARRWGALAESMEGAAAAHICALYGVPFLEIRGISNRSATATERVGRWRGPCCGRARAALAVVDSLGREGDG